MMPLLLVVLLGVGPTLNHCQFTWTDTSADFVSFNIYIGTASGGPYVKVGSLPGSTATSYGPTANLCGGLPDGQKYAVVKAVNAAGTESGPSNESPFVVNTAVPGSPANLGVQ